MGGRANPRQPFFPTTHRALPTTHNTQHTTTHNPQDTTHNTQCITHNTQHTTQKHTTNPIPFIQLNLPYSTHSTQLTSLSFFYHILVPFSSCSASFFPVFFFFFFIRSTSTPCSCTRVTCVLRELLTCGVIRSYNYCCYHQLRPANRYVLLRLHGPSPWGTLPVGLSQISPDD